MTNPQPFLTGDKKLDRALFKVGRKIAEKAVAAGVRAALSDMTKAMRSEVQHATVKKTIAARFKRKKRFGITEAKAGAGVGKHKGGKGGTNGGVGISKQNAHWYFMGTNSRVTDKTGASRGVMPMDHSIVIGAAKSRQTSILKLKIKTWQVIEKEVNKLSRK